MDAEILKGLAPGILVLAGFFFVLWIILRSHPQGLLILSILVGIIGVMVEYGTGWVSHRDAVKITVEQGAKIDRKASPSKKEPRKNPTPGVRKLPVGSPLKESGTPHMETVCADLGLPEDAWVPGQTKPGSIEGRKLRGDRQAYKWTCGGKPPVITRDQIGDSCRKHNWGDNSWTWDPNYAYSWYCS